jgi:hypothetical protein
MATPRLSSPLVLEDRTLWFGTIELYEDTVVISGWGWWGPVSETIPLERIAVFEKWTTLKGQNFCFVCDERASVWGRIEQGVELWALELKNEQGIELKRRH